MTAGYSLFYRVVNTWSRYVE